MNTQSGFPKSPGHDEHKVDKYEAAAKKRQEYIDAILTSNSKKKIVVAGPGTGKTFLFKKVLEGKSNALTLTFVNSLVEDLSLELCGLSEVKTLHSFARSILGRSAKAVRIFPKLSQVVGDDAQVLLGKEIDFDAIFNNRDDENQYLDFYRSRWKYYGKYFGYSDIVFAAVKQFEKNPESVPTYGQIVVDEFQDFNKLEVSLIDSLADKSPILVAGDDDQALYAFKNASAEHIRHRHGENSPDYTSFSLPFCSRCTNVIVDATNDLLAAAINAGFLNNRINKSYEYFVDKKKDLDSSKYSTITYTQVYSKQIPWFIGSQIAKIAENLREKFPVLIISPTKTQCRNIVAALREKGFQNVSYVDRRDDKNPSLLEGLKILLEDPKSNLGWRIVLKVLLKEANFNKLLVAADKDHDNPLEELVDTDIKKSIKKMLTTLRRVRDEENVDSEDIRAVLVGTEIEPYEMAGEALRDELVSASKRVGNPGIRKIPIKVTTIQSSKGLAEEYVFITHFDDQYFVGDGGKTLSDQDICNFLVALTRAKKKVFLISSRKEDPMFLKWICKDRIDRV